MNKQLDKMRLDRARLDKARLDEDRIDLSKILLRWFLIKATEILSRFHRNLVKVSVLTKSGQDFRQDLGWGHGIDSKELYKN